MKMPVKVKRIGNHSLPLPKYETEGAAGFDLRLCLGSTYVDSADMVIASGVSVVVPVGFAFEIPVGHEMQVRPRSGLSSRGLRVTVGTVDSDYRGEVRVHLRYEGPKDSVVVAHGDRIAQGVIAPVVRAELVEAEELSETARGGNGFGSTGQS